MEIFLAPRPLGSDKNKGSSAKDPRVSFPSLKPNSEEPLHLWLHPGTTLEEVDLSGWKHVTVMPWVPSFFHGGGAKLIRDWTDEVREKFGPKPVISELTIRGSGFTIVNVEIKGDLITKEQKSKVSEKEEEPDEPVLVVIKGVKAKRWLADDWEVVQGTLDDVEIDTVEIAASEAATGVEKVTLVENTDFSGKPKGNVRVREWKKVRGKKDRNGKPKPKESIGLFRFKRFDVKLEASSGKPSGGKSKGMDMLEG